MGFFGVKPRLVDGGARWGVMDFIINVSHPVLSFLVLNAWALASYPSNPK